jgi:hypothetical protein
MKAGSKKCHSCGKMAEKPYVYHIVPTRKYGVIPTYTKNEKKTNRVDLKGDMKVAVYNYCNRECYEITRPQKVSQKTYQI